MERFCCNATLNLLLKDIKNKYLALSKQYNQNTLTLTLLLLTCVLWASSTIMSFHNPMYFILFIFTLCQIAIDKPTCLLTHLFGSWAAPSSSDCGLTFLSGHVGFRCSTLKVDLKRDDFSQSKMSEFYLCSENTIFWTRYYRLARTFTWHFEDNSLSSDLLLLLIIL